MCIDLPGSKFSSWTGRSFLTSSNSMISDLLQNFIYYCLLDECVIFKDDIMEIKRICSKGCSQGSVTSPNLWNLYMNQLLSLNGDILILQAFAHDLALVSAGRVREELENNTNKALDAIANKLK
ncbi:hypothetical protein AVEN_161071-1 [Araneus ventricosus]|uniref:Reverse transcriptase domain-containing protein n=1 Tax=Araneus ventricosus TaxID=182803 RepID=A0A4Y2DX49_ARAVE|nr:hypothetical protein AVEN_161071-1 [Araneus ventricosus]